MLLLIGSHKQLEINKLLIMATAWIIYILILILSYHWILTSKQAMCLIEIGAHVLFIRKLGVYTIRISRNFRQLIERKWQ